MDIQPKPQHPPPEAGCAKNAPGAPCSSGGQGLPVVISNSAAEITPAAAAEIAPAAIDAALVLAYLRSPNDTPDIDKAVTSLTAANLALLHDADGAAITSALARQMVVLEAVFMRCTLNATYAKTPEQAVALMKQALNAHAHWLRAASVLVAAKGGARVLPS